jgi:hypothetical protein
VGLFCHDDEDECQRDADCRTAGTGDHCAYVVDEDHWVCDDYVDCP